MKKSINYIEEVKKFMTLFGQPTPDTIIDIPEDRNELRIALIFEELKEYAEASGLDNYFNELCSKNPLDPERKNEVRGLVNKVEQFDALLDLQYVLSGAVIEHGFDTIFDEGFEEVHRSNMSKACTNGSEALITVDRNSPKNTKCNIKRKGDFFIIKTLAGKVIKSINYSPANLKPILNAGMGNN